MCVYIQGKGISKFKHMDMVSNVENICILINPLNNLQNHLLGLSSHVRIEEDFHYFKLC